MPTICGFASSTNLALDTKIKPADLRVFELALNLLDYSNPFSSIKSFADLIFGSRASLFAWADAMREKIGDHRPPVEQASVERDLEVIHSKVNDSDFARLWAEGQNMTVDEAVALALEE